MQHMSQQSLFMNSEVFQFLNRMVDIPAAYRSWYAQCTLCNRPWTFTGTVLWSACCCATTGALVVPRRILWSLRSCSGFGRRPVLGQDCCARWCNDWGPRNAWFDYGYMLKPRYRILRRSLRSVFMLLAVLCDSEVRALATEAVLVKLESPLCNKVDGFGSFAQERCKVKGKRKRTSSWLRRSKSPFTSIWSHQSVLRLCTPVSGPSWESRFPGHTANP